MPRAKRTKQVAVEEPQMPSEVQEPPKCASCGHELDWRDRFYVPVPKSVEDAAPADAKPRRKKKAAESPVAAAAVPTLCKRCHQRNWHARLGVVAFHPATAKVQQGDKTVEVLVRDNRAARRKPAVKLPEVPRDRKPTRAERRAAARAKAAAADAAAA